METFLQNAEKRARGEKVSPDPIPKMPLLLHSSTKSEETLQTMMQHQQYRVLGIDTALRKTGWGILDCAGKKVTAVDCGAVINKPKASLCECLSRLHGAARELLEHYKPDIISIEGGFYCKNVHTSTILGTARGAVLGYIAEKGLPIYEYAPRYVKQIVCGFGNASKQQVAMMISQILKIHIDQLSDDSTDALALAYCHTQNQMRNSLDSSNHQI